MIDSRDRRLSGHARGGAAGRLAAAVSSVLIGVAVGLSGADASAQGSTPLRLTPLVPDAVSPLPASPPQAASPSPLSQPVPPALSIAPPSPVQIPAVPMVPERSPEPRLPDADITVQPLGAPDPDDAGLDRPGHFAGDLWYGSSLPEIVADLEALPAPMTSPAQKNLALRLLLSGGAVPVTEPGTTPPKRRFGALRVEKVAALGAPAEARALADKLPGVLADEGAAHALARAELVAGSIDCGKAIEMARGFDGDFWQRLGVFCRANRNDQDAANLGLDLLREREALDPAFETAIETMLGSPPAPISGIAKADSVTLAALRAAKLAPPVDALGKTAPEDAGLIARNPGADAKLRAAAAERAATVLHIDARELAAAYAAAAPAASPTPEDMVRLRETAERESSSHARSLVYAAATATADPRRRAEIAALAGRVVPASLRSGPIGAVFASLFDTLPANPANIALAATAFRLYAAQGQREKARRWYQLLRSDPRLAAEADAAWPLAGLSEVESDAADGIDDWLARESALAARTRATALLPVMDVLGIAVPAELHERALAASALASSPALTKRLDTVYGEGRVGETVLLALRLLGEGGPGSAAPGVLGQVADSLSGLGLTRDAWTIGRDAAASLVD